MSVSQAATLLKLGLGGPRRPVDDLIDRLGAADGSTWLVNALEEGPVRGMGSSPDLLAHGKATLDQLAMIKDRSKALLKTSPDPEARLAGIAGYFLSIAAGMRHHGRLIGGRGREEMTDVLLDLAAAAPEPFSALMSEAALAKFARP